MSVDINTIRTSVTRAHTFALAWAKKPSTGDIANLARAYIKLFDEYIELKRLYENQRIAREADARDFIRLKQPNR
jgi:hypothetical protein